MQTKETSFQQTASASLDVLGVDSDALEIVDVPELQVLDLALNPINWLSQRPSSLAVHICSAGRAEVISEFQHKDGWHKWLPDDVAEKALAFYLPLKSNNFVRAHHSFVTHSIRYSVTTC